jgi:hypothetical protein
MENSAQQSAVSAQTSFTQIKISASLVLRHLITVSYVIAKRNVPNASISKVIWITINVSYAQRLTKIAKLVMERIVA